MHSQGTRGHILSPLPSNLIPIPYPIYGCILDVDMQDQGNKIFDHSEYGGYGVNSGSSAVTGYTGLVRLFDGVDDLINFGKPAHLNNLSQMTIETWFNRRSFGGGSTGRHLDKVKWLLYCPGANQIYFQRAFSTSNGYWNANAAILNGRWYHVAMTYDSSNASNTPMFYVNGKLAGTTTITSPVGVAVSDAGDNLIIGNYAAQTRGFDGWMGITRLYNRILSSKDILQSYRCDAWRYGLMA